MNNFVVKHSTLYLVTQHLRDELSIYFLIILFFITISIRIGQGRKVSTRHDHCSKAEFFKIAISISRSVFSFSCKIAILSVTSFCLSILHTRILSTVIYRNNKLKKTCLYTKSKHNISSKDNTLLFYCFYCPFSFPHLVEVYSLSVCTST